MTTDDYDFQPPQDLDAERAVLGAMLLSPRALQDVSDVLNAQHFYAPKHGAIFDAMQHLAAAGDPVDPITLLDKLMHDSRTGNVDGAYIHTLVQTVPTTANADYYAAIVLDKYRLRRLSEAATRTLQLVATGAAGADVDEVIDRARAAVDAVATEGRQTVNVSFEDAMTAYITEADSPLDPAISTGIKELDDQLGGGVRAGQLIVLGARPGMGKSVLGINLATAAADAGHGVFFASLEMSETDCMHRVVSSVGSVPMANLVRRELTPDDYRRRGIVLAQASQWALKIDANPHQTLATIRATARDLKRTNRGLQVLIVDYLQLMAGSGKRHDRRDLEIGENTRGLKLLAKELGIAVIALCQVNRGAEQRQDRRPALSDLRESGSIENDADTVVLVHRNLTDPQAMDYVELIVAKQRSGPTGVLELFWSGAYQRITGHGRSHLAAV